MDAQKQIETEVRFEDVARRFAPSAAHYVASHYSRYLVTPEDCKQEIYVWLYSEKGTAFVEKRLASRPQQVSRIRFKLRSIAKQYAEKMKAEKVGYDLDDIQWYTPAVVQALLPLALDEQYDGAGVPDYEGDRPRDNGPRAKKNPAEMGDVKAMVMDVRLALEALPEWVFLTVMFQDTGMNLYDSAVGAIVDYLGGPKEYIGKRRVMSNAEAMARTGENYG